MKKPKKKKLALAPETPQNAPAAERPVSFASGPAESPAADEPDSEPMARSAAVPALVFAIFGVLLFWGDLHLVSQGGEMDARVQYPFESIKEVDSLHIKAAVDPRISRGEGVYNLVCKACHQEDGQGGIAQGCPPLVGSEWVLAKDPSRLPAIVIKGLTGPITVKDKPYGSGTMTPFDGLSDEDIASVLSFVRNNWGNKAPLVDPVLVKKIRAKFTDRGGYMDVPTLMTIPIEP